MSRFTLICSLVLALSSSTLLASRAEAQFATAPPVAGQVGMKNTERPTLEERVVVDRAAVRAALAKARATNLAAFRAYQHKGVFPSNTYEPRKLNVWLDRLGHFCAAATIIQRSGQDDLVHQVAEQNNFVRLADVTQGPLMDWILTSGFTQDEIARIQEPFLPVTDEPSLAPPPPVLVDATLRAREDARLRRTYRAVDRQLVKHATRSLDRAVDRLMKHPALARQLVTRQS